MNPNRESLHNKNDYKDASLAEIISHVKKSTKTAGLEKQCKQMIAQYRRMCSNLK